MKNTELYVGSTKINSAKKGGTGAFVKVNGETFYKISGVDSMDPFFMTVVSHSDHWMFISSNGGLSAGRKNPESALFPYYTDDKITDNYEMTGSKTLFKVLRDEKTFLWEPFSDRYAGAYSVKRNLYKNVLGNKLIFEEVNEDLKIAFQYQWVFSDLYGFVKKASLKNLGEDVKVNVLDGVQNILPPGVGSLLQLGRSTLVDAYKKNELVKESDLGIFALSSMIVDKAEPSEALRATTVWSKGLENTKYLLSSDQLDSYRRGEEIKEEKFTKAVKAAFFVNANVELKAKAEQNWVVVAELNQSTKDVIDLSHQLNNGGGLLQKLHEDIDHCTNDLKRLVGLSDGLQMGQDSLCTSRHFSNVLFNIMRGGIFEDQYRINVRDLEEHCRHMNPTIYRVNEDFFKELPNDLGYQQLIDLAKKSGTEDLQRICIEYLPLSFSRRHGDPSRPWNYFNIDIGNEQEKKYNYEGNWRDIFQNWEALAYSFPQYIEGMISKFVNASTIDGYNPYRITREGIDWEVIEEDDPWSYIGYWGDHQIIYLQKLMEHAQQHNPGLLLQMLEDSSYVYANVPYKIKGYQAMVQNPNDTIDFDFDEAHKIDQLVSTFGADGKIIRRGLNTLTANFAEKLLVMLLSKLYNFVPDGGIWLNTQRPEWNDANNALVGNGLSMVTLNYLSRSIKFIQELFEDYKGSHLQIHGAVDELLHSLLNTFKSAPKEFDAQSRRQFVDALGIAGETYRTKAYAHFQGGTKATDVQHIIEFLSVAKELIDKTIFGSKREDGLYHAYNLVSFSENEAQISYLYEMLEGQVAALSSGLLPAEEAANLLDSLKWSEMFQREQYSYMLYPNRVLKTFISKNNIPKKVVDKSTLIPKLMEIGHASLIEKDKEGNYHFSGDIHNAEDVMRELENIRETIFFDLKDNEIQLILNGFETVFDHLAFTGRSGTFYGYEGLGSIYWHMVSKLLLSVQENVYKAQEENASAETIGRLLNHYYEIRAGIGINKEPKLYGAFPTDAYSHTPDGGGAQQPGLTGQVKEDVLNRWAELGIQVKDGKITFNPIILDKEEFLRTEGTFEYFDVNQQAQTVRVQKGEMVFTYCGVLIIYRKSDQNSVRVLNTHGEKIVLNGMEINPRLSREIFNRKGSITEVLVKYNFDA